MDQEKLQKLFALAADNPNLNEASVAALKFVHALKKTGQTINITLGNQNIVTQEQVETIANDAYKKGYEKGYENGYNEAKINYGNNISYVNQANQTVCSYGGTTIFVGQ